MNKNIRSTPSSSDLPAPWTRRAWLQASGAATLGLATAPLAGLRSAGAQEFSEAPIAPADAAGNIEHPFWLRLRNEFLLDPGLMHFDTAAYGIPPIASLEMLQTVVQRQGGTPSEQRGENARRLAQTLSEFFGTSAGQVTMTCDADSSLDQALCMLPWKPGARVFATAHSRPENLAKLRQLAQRQSFDLRWYDATQPDRALALLASQVEAGSVVIASHVLPSTGALQPIEAISRVTGPKDAWLVVEGSEAAGIQSFSLGELGADIYIASGSRYLLAPLGTAFVYFDERAMEQALYWDERGQRRKLESLDRLQVTPVNAGLAAAFENSLRWLQGLGIDTVRSYCQGLTRRLYEICRSLPGVRVLTDESSLEDSPILALKFDRRPASQVQPWFHEQMHMQVHSVTQAGLDAVRVSPYLQNRVADVDWLAEGVRALGE